MFIFYLILVIGFQFIINTKITQQKCGDLERDYRHNPKLGY